MNPVHLPRSAGIILGGTFVALGGLILLVGVVWLTRAALFAHRAVRVTGQIVDNAEVRGAGTGVIYYPVYVFTDAAGVRYTQRAVIGSSRAEFSPAQSVAVLYDPKSPKDSKIEPLGSVWAGPLFAVGFGVLATGCACIFLLAFLRVPRHARSPG